MGGGQFYLSPDKCDASFMLGQLHHEEKYDYSPEDRVCNIHIFRNGDYAEFRYRCCHVSLDDGLVCEDLVQDDWVKVRPLNLHLLSD